MNLSRWFFPELRSRLFGHRRQAAGTPLMVRNVTRRTELASRLQLADSGPARAKGLLGHCRQAVRAHLRHAIPD